MGKKRSWYFTYSNLTISRTLILRKFGEFKSKLSLGTYFSVSKNYSSLSMNRMYSTACLPSQQRAKEQHAVVENLGRCTACDVLSPSVRSHTFLCRVFSIRELKLRNSMQNDFLTHWERPLILRTEVFLNFSSTMPFFAHPSIRQFYMLPYCLNSDAVKCVQEVVE